MRHLNYSHLHYFWAVAREGSIVRASEVLNLTPQTISSQLKLLEAAIGQPLFSRAGRGLVLTETGRIVNEYAQEIFSLGAELTHRVRSGEPGKKAVLHVGILNSIPKLIACRILEPAVGLEEPVRIVCHESGLDELLGDLAVHRIDLVLSDHPIPAGLNVRAYNHSLGESGISFFAHAREAKRYRKNFPESLHEAPALLPIGSSAMRRGLDEWFERVGVSPQVVAEFEDSALLKAFGEAGHGVFPAPTAIAGEVTGMYSAEPIGNVDGVKEAYFAISPERKLKHPAVLKITAAARSSLFQRS